MCSVCCLTARYKSPLAVNDKEKANTASVLRDDDDDDDDMSLCFGFM